jgi:UDP-N-acetylmuramate--alanine ligase
MTHIHLIGIGGTGLSAIARVLLEMGHTVSGSDRAESSFTRDLRSAGVTIYIGHNAENVNGSDLVVRSSAIPDDNIEVTAAISARIPVLKRAEFLGSLMKNKTCIAVAGTHGKTTTSAMIAWMLTALNQEPSFIVGGVLKNLSTNARYGKGKIFVIEADEYDRMFLGLQPTIEVVTNIEHDHPDCYPTLADLQTAFLEFVNHLTAGGTLILCGDDPGGQSLLEKAEKSGKAVLVFGLEPDPNRAQSEMCYANLISVNGKGGFTFNACVLGNLVSVELQVPGKHNILNALAVLTVAQLLGLPLKETAHALGQFTGTDRRFEIRGEVNGITVIDDYAHHPTEIQATLAAARYRFPDSPIWVVWQPHTYSRTTMLLNDFANSFSDADEVIITEVYPAREPKQAFSSIKVVEAMRREAHFIADLTAASNYLITHLRPGDVLLVLSAGDADQISTSVLAHLQNIHDGQDTTKDNASV